MGRSFHDADWLEFVTPPRLPDRYRLAFATALAAPRRRVYEVTSDPTGLGHLLEGYPNEPRPFRCGHTCRYVTPAARHLLREVEPQMVCLWCLTCAVHDELGRDLYPDFAGEWLFGSNDTDHAAIARYYISLVELYHELTNPGGAAIMAEIEHRTRYTLSHLLWNQFTTFHTEEWLGEDSNISLLQGAIQVIRHLNRAKHHFSKSTSQARLHAWHRRHAHALGSSDQAP